MTCILTACTDPFTSFTHPIYKLATSGSDTTKRPELQQLVLATLRTATAAAFFFMIIPFNHFLGHHDNLSGSFAITSQFIVHPYAAALFNAFMNGGYPLVMKVIDIFASRQLIFTRDDLGGCVSAIGFFYLAKCLKENLFKISPVDQKYQNWANRFAHWWYST